MTSQIKRVPNVRGEGERLRQEILGAATRILEETGREDALSLRGVAREVGIAAPSVYRHFKSKADLVTTVLDVTYRALAVAMSEAGESATAVGADPWERVRAIVTAYRRFAIDKPRRYRLMFSLEYEPERRPSADTPLGTVLQAWTHAVDTYLAAIAPARRSEAEIVGIHLWTALHGQLVLWHTLPGHHTSSEDILTELEQSLLHRLLPGPAPQPSTPRLDAAHSQRGS
ncbi:TetR/AcrR family transcriptional regulator [Amycolatopsis sp. NPDC021455]|uniref:TetR/AcrR family transcriptional regulator n=1 Tax=Amycolatopsis sp. NPDC021455 TaxID=3154901 RepID=UPI0034086032